MISIEQAVEQFKFELPEEVRLTCQSPEFARMLQEIGNAHKIDLSALLVYFAVGEVTLDKISEYLEREEGLDQAKAAEMAKELEEKVFKTLMERLDFLNENPDKDMALPQEKNYLERIFKNDLLRELAEDPVIAAAVNRRLFFVLARDEEFHKRLEQLLYENDELVTVKPIMIDGQSVKPTVSNWLKDFISHYGSQNYDSVSLSAFLINSENARQLSDEEREAVALVLKVYTNIKFFPESMPEDETGASWQIIPYEDEEKKLAEIAEQVSPPAEPAPPTPKPAPAIAPIAKPVPAEPKPEPKIEPKIETKAPPAAAPADSPELLELKNMLLQYPAGSLERAAIEEEIKKLTS